MVVLPNRTLLGIGIDMIRSVRNEVLNMFHKGGFGCLVTETFLRDMVSNPNDLMFIANSKMSVSDSSKVGFDDKTPTFVIQHPEALEKLDINMEDGSIADYFKGVPFDEFVVEREPPNYECEDSGFGSFRQLTAFSRRDDTVDGRQVWEISSVNLTGETSSSKKVGFPRCLLNPLKCIVTVDLKNNLVSPAFHSDYSFAKKIPSLKLIDSLPAVLAEDSSLNLSESEAALKLASMVSVWRDGVFDLIHLTRILEAKNVEQKTVSAPKLPPKEKKRKGDKYNKHNDYIVLSVKSRTSSRKASPTESGGSGSPKRPHPRRGHRRSLASGDKIYVSPAYIKGGGAAGQEYII